MGGGGGGGGVASNGGSVGPKPSAQFTDMINRIAAMKRPSSAEAAPTPGPSSTVAATAAEDQQRLEQVIGGALARAQVFLDNDAARQALGSTSLQTFIYKSDVNDEGNHAAAFFLDAATGE